MFFHFDILTRWIYIRLMSERYMLINSIVKMEVGGINET
jgi:hypothetical protein